MPLLIVCPAAMYGVRTVKFLSFGNKTLFMQTISIASDPQPPNLDLIIWTNSFLPLVFNYTIKSRPLGLLLQSYRGLALR